MRLLTFTEGGDTRIGAQMDDQVVDFSVVDPALPTEMVALLEGGETALAKAKAAIESGRGRIALAGVKLEAPILRPPKILAIGLNYAAHAAENKIDPPPVPLVFNKQSLSANGPYDPIHKPAESEQLDYEGELAVVIGRRCRRVPQAEAMKMVAGYTIVNDVSIRDWQMAKPVYPHTMGKSWDTHCPMGPVIVTADELTDPHVLDLEVTVNGELRQKANTSDFIFNIPWLIEHLTTAFTLEVGDVIPTGTPSGAGAFMDPKGWMKHGDVVKVKIFGIGEIENPVIDEPADTVSY
jgi:2-keto-4-pentenoate hydratase/2-oxohepta-3-ene-1,7-dioic acid hydratase in catechol pathway